MKAECGGVGLRGSSGMLEQVETTSMIHLQGFLSLMGQSKQDFSVNGMFWQVGHTAFEALSMFIVSRKEKCLKETKAVLARREQLKLGIEHVREQIELGMRALERLEITMPNIIKAQTLIETNQNFEFQVTEMETVKKPKMCLYNTVCTNCNWTCHKDCTLADDNRKMKCCAMDRECGNCKHCPNKCHWSDHKNLDFYYDRVPVTKKQANKELYDRYVNANSDKSKFDQVVDGLRKEFNETQFNVYESVVIIQEMINELQEIALRPSVFHKDEYFDVMIECERKEKREGWQQRIKAIEEIQQRSKLCHEIGAGGYDPFAEGVAQVKQGAMKLKITVHIEEKPKTMPTAALS